MTMRVDCAQFVCAALTIAWNFALPKLVMTHTQLLNSLANSGKQLVRKENHSQAWANFHPALELARDSPPIAAPRLTAVSLVCSQLAVVEAVAMALPGPTVACRVCWVGGVRASGTSTWERAATCWARLLICAVAQGMGVAAVLN